VGMHPCAVDEYDLKKITYGLMTMKVKNPLPLSNVGINLLDRFFPNRFIASTDDSPSLVDALKNEKIIRRTIEYLLKSGRTPTAELIERNVKFIINMPSHFPPSAACVIYKEYGTRKRIYDPFAGWGGRSLAAMVSTVDRFVATDLQSKSIEGCMKLREILKPSGRFDFYNQDCVEFMNKTEEKFDLIFSSPPFFNTEKYDGVSYASDRQWLEGLVFPFVKGVKRILDYDGICGLHLQDRERAPTLSVFFTAFRMIGFNVVKEYNYGRTNQKVLMFQADS
jgi:16S rRNA G966 N2-methylase RsmD